MGKVCVAGAGDVRNRLRQEDAQGQRRDAERGDPNQHQRLDGDVFNGLIKTADSELKQVWSTRP